MLGGLVSACGGSSIVVVDVDADSAVPTVMHLHATLSNAGVADEKTFPLKGAPAPGLTFPTAFSLTLPGSRGGALDIAIDGLDASGAVVANGDGSTFLDPGGTITIPVQLHAGPSLCGNGRIDPGETCDDGDRISSGGCDFRCQIRTPTAGTGGMAGSGAPGTGGMGGGPGTGGTTGVAGGGGAAGGGGSTGTGGSGSCNVELLTNGDFDAGDVGWTSVTSGRALVYNSADVDPSLGPTPVSPPGMAWLGFDVLNETVLLGQAVQVPSDAQTVTVTGYVQIWTDDSQTVPYDLGYLEVLVGAFTQEVDHWTNTDFGTDWVSFTHVVDVSGARGSTATVQLRVVMDDGANTSFFFDSLSAVANRCP